MKTNTTILCLGLLLAVTLSNVPNQLFAQKVVKKKFPIGYSFDSECVGTALDGSPVITAWGRGYDKREALKKAYQQAVIEIIFNGTRGNDDECNTPPLATEANTDEEYAKYFNKLLYKNKKYLKYIEKDDRFSRDEGIVYKHPDNKDYLAKVTVAVLRAKLKKKFVSKDIIDKYKKEKKLYR